MMMLSAFPSRFLISGILSAIFAPPRIARSGRLRLLQHGGEGLELRLHQEARRLLGQRDADHRRMRAVGGAERIVHEDVPQAREARAERGHRGRIGLLGGAVLPLDLALLLEVEAQVLQEDHLARRAGARRPPRPPGRRSRRRKRDGLAEQLLQLGGHRPQGVLGRRLPVGAPQVAHQDDGGALPQRVLDRRQRGGDPLVVRDRAGGLVLRHVEVDAHQHALAGEVEIADGLEFWHGGRIGRRTGRGRPRAPVPERTLGRTHAPAGRGLGERRLAEPGARQSAAAIFFSRSTQRLL